MINLIIPILIAVFSIGFSNSELIDHSDKKNSSCLKIADFNFVASYIVKHGNQINEIEGTPIDKGSLVYEITIGNQFIRLMDYQGDKVIILYDKSKEPKMSPTRVVIKKNKVHISAYYSEIETEQSLIKKRKIWCDLITATK